MKDTQLSPEQLEKIALLRDHKFYLENFCRIKTKSRGLEPFKLNEAQKDLFNTLRESNRVMILKARQMGFSTGVTGFFYVDTIMNPGTTTALIGYNSDLTSELLDKIKTFYKTTPPELRPTIQYNSKYEISFPELNSKILVLPSTDDVGRGYTLNNVLCTELAFWDKDTEKMMALQESVPADGRIVIESTPNGVGNMYHKMWVTDNGYSKKEYGWWWGYTEEDMQRKKKEIGDMAWAQEYGCEFLTSGRPVFDFDIIKEQKKNILKVGDKNGFDKDGNDFIVHKREDWIIYQEPIPGHMYVVGGDVAEGVKGGDYSVAVIWDRITGEEVAFYRGHIAPDTFGEVLDKMGRYYNNALMTVEVNNHGLTTLTVLKQKAYPMMYFRPAKFDALGAGASDRLGWRTTVLTRPLLINDFRTACRDGSVKIRSKFLIDEMLTFVFNRTNDMVALDGYHDDCIFAASIGIQGFKILYDKQLEQIDYKKYMPRRNSY